MPLSPDLAVNLLDLQTRFSLTPDLTVRRFQIKSSGRQAVKMPITISSLDSDYDNEKATVPLEARIVKELQKKFADLIHKCQKSQVDPFGFGLYARAYRFPEWKAVENEWGKTFAKAKVSIITQVEIKSVGVVY
ncbi:MAG: spore gernimation protein [Paenibacillus sp.]|jgi:hypothetical protein|nr:spore gernimation protein [Paenibacillus sp.]